MILRFIKLPLINIFQIDMDKPTEDPSTKELNAFVQNMLKQMQDRFEEMSGNIVGRVDEMGNLLCEYR